MADDPLEGKRNLALQTVNIPLMVRLMFTPYPENALDTDDILSLLHTTTNLLIDLAEERRGRVCVCV